MTYEETIILEKKVLNDEISVANAKELFFKDVNKKSWHTSDWKKRRDMILKDECEICGSVDTLTLQHRFHPRKYYEYENEITYEYIQLYVDFNKLVAQEELLTYVEANFDYLPLAVCPNCENKNPNIRAVKKPQYLCTNCKFEFDEPNYKTMVGMVFEFYNNLESVVIKSQCFVSKDKYRKKQNLSQIKRRILIDLMKEKYKEEIEKKAFLKYLQDNIRYLSFEDTITCCRKCAFNSDLNNASICPICKKNYKGTQYPTCYHCLPEEERNKVSEKRRSAQAFQDLHKGLEID